MKHFCCPCTRVEQWEQLLCVLTDATFWTGNLSIHSLRPVWPCLSLAQSLAVAPLSLAWLAPPLPQSPGCLDCAHTVFHAEARPFSFPLCGLLTLQSFSDILPATQSGRWSCCSVTLPHLQGTMFLFTLWRSNLCTCLSRPAG